MKDSQRKKREKIDWKGHVAEAQKWIAECREVGVNPTTTQIQNHFGWSQTVASKVKSFIEIIDSKENEANAQQ